MQQDPHATPDMPVSPQTPGSQASSPALVREASFAQQRIWFLSQLPGASEAYNEPLAFTLEGRLNRRVLADAFDSLCARHETLRTRLVGVAGEVKQHIDPPDTGFRLNQTDLTKTPDAPTALSRLRASEAGAPFDLAGGPLGRGHLVALDTHLHVLLLTFHHSIYDGWSMNVMMHELGLIYDALLTGTPSPLPPLAIQYADHAAAQRAAVLGGSLKEQETYWRQTLEGAPTVLDLPTDRPRPARQQHAGGRVTFTLDTQATAALSTMTRRHRATPFVGVLTGWTILLSRLSGQSDIVVGSPVANRRGAGAAPLIGFFANSLALRVDLTGTRTASDALTQVRNVVRGALDHQELPFERVVELVNPPRSAAHPPLFQTMLAWVPDRTGLLQLPGVTADPLPIAQAPAKFDLALSVTESDGCITGHLDYSTALFDEATARRYADHLRHLLIDLAAHPEREITTLNLMSQAEQERLLAEGTTTILETGRPSTSVSEAERAEQFLPPSQRLLSANSLTELFEAQVHDRPHQPAVVCEGQMTDYATLNRRANHLAQALAARSVGPGDVVGLHTGRRTDLLVGILGILKSGAAYLPLDPAQPQARLDGMVEDAACPLVLSDHAEPVRPAGWLDLTEVEAEGTHADVPPPVPRTQSDLAYVIFTSGSTGRPKGVAVEHRSVLNLFDNWHDQMGTRPGDIGSAWSSIGFDASVHELLLPLTSGGTVHIVPEHVRGDPAALMEWLCEHRVVQAFLPPSYIRWIDEDPDRRLHGLQLRTLLTGVESLSEAALHRITRHLPGLKVCFGYGPTEATLYSIAHYDPQPLDRQSPLGRPLRNTWLRLLDAHLQPALSGTVGEVYLGGACLARGYINRPDLTEERFIPDPFLPGHRLYRTGDLARRLPDGSLHYVGRADDQVKLRGFRIEPAEIESALLAQPGVREAAVLTDHEAPGGPRLVAAIGRGEAPQRDAHQWRADLASRLPDYMLPTVYLDLPTLPLNRSGKLDRQTLLDLSRAHHTNQVNTASPRDHIELAVYRIWRDILLQPDIGISDDFFVLGGTSLAAIKMAHAITKEFGIRLPVAEIMLRPTIEALAGALREGHPSDTPSSLIDLRQAAPLPGDSTPRVVCVHPAGGTAFCYLPLASLLPETVELYGIQSPGVNPGEELLPDVEAMAAAYLDLIGPVHQGPLVLTGLSYGGLIAHEMGRLLARSGQQNVSVVLLDTQATDDPAERAAMQPVDMAEFRDKLVRFNGMYPGIDDAQIERYFRIYNHNRATARAHVPAASSARVVLVQAVGDGSDAARHTKVQAFWRRRAREHFHVEPVPCGHWEMLQKTEAVRVARVIADELVHHGALPTASQRGTGSSASNPKESQ
ncbi:amino acid adenylation domain-containing protein [Streptomyces sp. NPDC026665]|uniref:non-ribosomal peptide synthetase n=1 Tax=Streptomyces sp. NPDC026665 TaxID=3154798 RepID=UPI0034024D14